MSNFVIGRIERQNTEKRVVVQIDTLSDSSEQFQQPITMVKSAPHVGPLYYNDPISDSQNKNRTVKIANTASALNFVDDIEIGKTTFLSVASLGDNVTTLLSASFKNCTSLVEFYASEGLKNIDDECFYGCTNLTYASMLDNNSPPLFRIGKHAFSRSGIKRAVLNIAGGLYNGPDTFSVVDDGAFENCQNLTEVQFVQSNNLGDGVFKNCTSLSSVVLNNRYGYFGTNMFENCTNLRHMKIPPYTHEIPAHTFLNCTNLTSLEFEDTDENRSTLTFLNDEFIGGCTNLKSLVLPRSINRWDDMTSATFYNSSIESLTFMGFSYDQLINTVVINKEIQFDYDLGHMYSTEYSVNQTIEIMKTAFRAGIPVIYIASREACSTCREWHDSTVYQQLLSQIGTTKYLWVDSYKRTLGEPVKVNKHNEVTNVDELDYLSWKPTSVTQMVTGINFREIIGYNGVPVVIVIWNGGNIAGQNLKARAFTPYGYGASRNGVFNTVTNWLSAYHPDTSETIITITDNFTGFGLNGTVNIYANDGRGITWNGESGAIIHDTYTVDDNTKDNFKWGTWYSNIEQLVNFANLNDQPVFIEYGSPGCGPCNQFNSVVFQNPTFQEWVKQQKIFFGKFSENNIEQYGYIERTLVPPKSTENPQTPYLICLWSSRGIKVSRWFCVDPGSDSPLASSMPYALKTVNDVISYITSYINNQGSTATDFYPISVSSYRYTAGSQSVFVKMKRYANIDGDNNGQLYGNVSKVPITDTFSVSAFNISENRFVNEIIQLRANGSVQENSNKLPTIPGTYWYADDYRGQSGYIFKVGNAGQTESVLYSGAAATNIYNGISNNSNYQKTNEGTDDDLNNVQIYEIRVGYQMYQYSGYFIQDANIVFNGNSQTVKHARCTVMQNLGNGIEYAYRFSTI